MAKRKVQNDDGAAAQTGPPVVAPVETPGTYVVNFRGIDSEGGPRQHKWLPPTITIDGCVSSDDARSKLHELFDKAIFQIERRGK